MVCVQFFGIATPVFIAYYHVTCEGEKKKKWNVCVCVYFVLAIHKLFIMNFVWFLFLKKIHFKSEEKKKNSTFLFTWTECFILGGIDSSALDQMQLINSHEWLALQWSIFEVKNLIKSVGQWQRTPAMNLSKTFYFRTFTYYSKIMTWCRYIIQTSSLQ